MYDIIHRSNYKCNKMSAEIQLKLGFVINFVYACFTVYEKIFTVDTNHEKSINVFFVEIVWENKENVNVCNRRTD